MEFAANARCYENPGQEEKDMNGYKSETTDIGGG